MNPRPREGPYPIKTLVVDPDRADAEALIRAAPIIEVIAIVPTAAEALNAMRVTMPQLLITEMALLDANGIELIARVRQMAAVRRLPIMVISSRSSVAEKVAAMRAGADDYLVKPVEPPFFTLRVRQLMIFSLLDIHQWPGRS
jgi:DNA-binding response OmpR family regulator